MTTGAGQFNEDHERGHVLSVLVPVFNERFLVLDLLERLQRVEIQGIRELQVIVVDDGSTDGTRELLREYLADREGCLYYEHAENRGKGAAIQTALEAATGDLVVIQDADLEYDPRDFARLTEPFFEDGADVVYGSRFLASPKRRVLLYKHSLGNKFITSFSNLLTDLNLTDVETGYKMFRTHLLRSIPIRSNDFAMEIELTAKVAKRNFRLFEVPISYAGRTYQEGKKIGWRDGARALWTAFRFWIVDDLYKDDRYGGDILHALERAQRFNTWMADALRPAVGGNVLEIGAGIGNLTGWLTPRDRYVVSDINENYLHYLKNWSAGRPYLEVKKVDLERAEDFEGLEPFDTVICLNVLEHVSDPMAALKNLWRALEPGGRAILYVPQGESLYSRLDEVLEHRCRYERGTLEAELEEVGFEIEEMRDFNRVSLPAWWWNGKILKRDRLSRWQLKIFDLTIPLVRAVDPFFPWKGLGLIAVARKPV